jgi:sugar-specific transcriptional regulator TrmB
MEAVKKTLRTVGLTDRESDVYVLLARHSFLSGSDVSKQLRMHKAQAYTILRNLQERGVIEATLETPTRYHPVPIEKTIDDLIRAKRREADLIEREKGAFLARWQAIQSPYLELAHERFATFHGRETVLSKLLDMIRDAKKELHIVMTGIDVILAQNSSLMDNLEEKLAEQHGLSLKLLAPISRENVGITKRLVKTSSGGRLDLEWRHTEIDPRKIPSMMTRDGEEACVFPAPDSHGDTWTKSALWTNSQMITRTCTALFEELWRDGIPADQKVSEIESRGHSSTSLTFEDAKVAQRRFLASIKKAGQEIVHLLPSSAILEDERMKPFWRASEKSVKMHVMCPIGSDRMKVRRALPRHAEIRDPNIDYLAVSLIDRQHLFRFDVRSGHTPHIDSSAYFKDTFYTNDPMQIGAMRQMLEGLWERSAVVIPAEPKALRKR